MLFFHSKFKRFGIDGKLAIIIIIMIMIMMMMIMMMMMISMMMMMMIPEGSFFDKIEKCISKYFFGK